VLISKLPESPGVTKYLRLVLVSTLSQTSSAIFENVCMSPFASVTKIGLEIRLYDSPSVKDSP